MRSFQAFDQVAEGFEEPANLPFSAVVEVNLKFRAILFRGYHFLKLQPLALDRAPPEELGDVFSLQIPVHPDLVALDDPVRWMGDPLGEIAVRRQDEQAFRILVESAGAGQSGVPQLFRQEVENRLFLVRVGVGADVVPGLVQNEGRVVLLAGQDPLSVHPDDRTSGGDGFTDPGRATVNFDAPSPDQFFGFAPRTHAGLGQEFLETNFRFHTGECSRFVPGFDPKDFAIRNPGRCGNFFPSTWGGIRTGFWMMADEIEEKKTALVTGASRGIGLAIARELGSAGFRVIAVARSEESASKAVDAVRADGGEAEAFGCDVGDADSVARVSETVLEKNECIDVLVNNAGITRDMLFIRMSDEDWSDVLRTNLDSCFHWCKNLARPMTRRRWGRVINISSVIGLTGNAGQANYAAAKAGMIGFTKSLAKELAPRSITVNAVAPGFVETDMTGGLGEEIRADILKMIPLKRMGAPEDIASLVGFLAGSSAGYITGQVFTVDGGMVM